MLSIKVCKFIWVDFVWHTIVQQILYNFFYINSTTNIDNKYCTIFKIYLLHCFDVCIWIAIWFESIYKYGFELYSIGLLYPFGRIDYFWFVQCNDVHWLLVTASCYNNVKHVFFIWSCWGVRVKITLHRPSFCSIFAGQFKEKLLKRNAQRPA